MITPMDVRCPYCRAVPGEACWNYQRKEITKHVHPERRRRVKVVYEQERRSPLRQHAE